MIMITVYASTGMTQVFSLSLADLASIYSQQGTRLQTGVYQSGLIPAESSTAGKVTMCPCVRAFTYLEIL